MQEDIFDSGFKKWFFIVLGSMLLCFISLFLGLLNYMNLSYEITETVIIVSFMVGLSTIVFATIYRNRTIGHSIVSLTILIALWFGGLVLNGYLGTVLWLTQIWNLQVPYENSADGLFEALFIYFIIISSIAMIIIKAVYIKLSVPKQNN